MRFFPWTMALFFLTCLLASCGGGGGTANTVRTPVQASCDSTLLYAAPNLSGLGIPDNDATGITLTWDNQACALQSVVSATLDICLNHPKPSDLVWTITSPASETPRDITAPINSSASSDDCDAGARKLQRIDLLNFFPSGITTLGRWSLKVKDELPGDVGTLIQWRVNIQGFQ